MKIFAQDGFGPADKPKEARDLGIIDGVVLSPRYSNPKRMKERVADLQAEGFTLVMDPEYYATDVVAHPNANCGSLEAWPYFQRQNRSKMISGAAIPNLIQRTVEAQAGVGLNAFIAPNLFIRQADSIDTGIAINILNQTKAAAAKVADGPVYGTIAIHRDAILEGDQFFEILDDLTGMETPPDGYYLILGSNEQNSSGKFVRSDLSHPRVIAAWMYANYVLSLNGAHLINGYCFLLSPLMGLCGAAAAASGWSSGLRKFCFDRYIRAEGRGGNQPNPRYVSAPLMAHVRQTDLDTFEAIAPGIWNGLSLDDRFQGDVSRTEEALQSWQGLARLAAEAQPSGDILDDLNRFRGLIDQARSRWIALQSAGITSEVEPNLERLQAMEGGIELFTQWAELA
ncbi:MAG: hypothetical protein JNK37_19800 [Verrucomicrobiales bacterium]|nr:hypothetical protein [Verrucomicrobiales bacterium]